MIHLPVLRQGQPYRSLSTQVLADLGTGAPVAEVSLANSGLIALDLARAARARRQIDELTTAELVAISGRAAELFTTAELPLGEGVQTPEDYVAQLSATTGLPRALARANMEKSRFVMAEVETVLGGLTRGLDTEILDRGYGAQDGRPVSYRREADVLGAVLPSNSPGVHSLWIPALTLKTALALKPGRQEPWTPFRVAQSYLAAGYPAAAFGFYPTDHAGAVEILLRSGRSLLFGDRATVEPWRRDPRVELHGPGFSKVVLDAAEAGRFEEHLDLLVASIADNGGRSCINASGVWTAARGRELAAALAERLAVIEALPLADPGARLAAFPSRRAAEAVSRHLDQALAQPGAEDVTARLRSGTRVAAVDGCWFVLPTVVWCEDAGHPLAQAEYLFPFAAVVEKPADELVAALPDSLVVTALVADPELRRELLASPRVERLNLGALPTSRVDWAQPHEGNLFQHLFRQRAFQAAVASESASRALGA